jgi:GMP synthase (glutamine-hydrolysing)
MSKIKPFLILQLRPEDEAADNELEAFIKFGRINDVERIRIDKEDLIGIDLNRYSGVIVGGGPSNVSDSEEKKSANQKRFEGQLHDLLDEIIEADFPFLGTCYGLGILAKHLGGQVSKEISKPVGAVEISLTKEGKEDHLISSIAPKFRAFAGHKESATSVPDRVTVLGGNKTCPIQIIKYQNNIYATQFHTELDQAGLALRINIYRHAGYFAPEDADMLIAESKREKITEPEKILAKFIEKYASFQD